MSLQIPIAIAAAALLIFGVAENWTRGLRARKSFHRGVDALDGDRRDEARIAFERVLKLQPLWAPARRILAKLYIDEGRYTDAEEHFRLACAFEPRNAEPLIELAWFLALFKGGMGEAQAGDALRKALELAPRILETHRDVPELAALRKVASLGTFFAHGRQA